MSLPFEPASVVAARAVVAGERPPAYCAAYVPRVDFTGYLRPQQWYEELRGDERWKQCLDPAIFSRETPEFSAALGRGEVRALQEHWSATLHDALLLLRKLAESESLELPGMRNERLRLRLVLAVHKELREILAEWDYLAAAAAPLVSPESKSRDWVRHLESFETP